MKFYIFYRNELYALYLGYVLEKKDLRIIWECSVRSTIHDLSRKTVVKIKLQFFA